MFNRVIICGRLGQDPEIREAGSVDVMSLSIATSKRWRDRDGEMKEQTQWHRCSVWNENAIKFGKEYLAQGDLVLLEGELEYRKWTNKEGAEVTSAEVIFRFQGELRKVSSPKSDGGDDRDRGRDDRRSDRRDDRSSRDSRDDRRRDDRRSSRDESRRGRDDERRGSSTLDDMRTGRTDDRRDSGKSTSSGSGGGWSKPSDDLDDDIPF